MTRSFASLTLSFCLAVCCPSVFGATIPDSTQRYFQLDGLFASDARTPFWLQANQFGIVPRGGGMGVLPHLGWIQSRTIRKADSTLSKWKVGFGLEVVGNITTNEETKTLLPQAYGRVAYGNWELVVGRRRQLVGLADSTLGTGSFIQSGNALPIPQVQFGLAEFTAVPFTKGWISIKGFYADGFFEAGRSVTSELLLHQKQFYARLGQPHRRFKLYGGFNHQVQWGGRSPHLTVDGQMPKGFNNYIRAVTGTRLSGQVDDATDFDNTNRVGNHLGTVDVGMEWDGAAANWFLYRQSIYEDGSLYYLTNIADGLHGIRVRRKNAVNKGFHIKEIVFEGLYTKSQGGPSFIINRNQRRGKDNYFNNAQVRDGWSYFDRTIGSPFISPTSDTRWRWPNLADMFTSNNRVWAFHVGMRGTMFSNVEWTTKLSYSSNGGTYDEPFKSADLPKGPYQFSGLFMIQKPTQLLGGPARIGMSFGIDNGNLYQNASGFRFSLRRDF